MVIIQAGSDRDAHTRGGTAAHPPTLPRKNMTVNHLAEVSGVSSSALKLTVSSYARVKSTGVVTIKKLCQGFGIDFVDFFSSDLFENLDDEEEA